MNSITNGLKSLGFTTKLLLALFVFYFIGKSLGK